MRSFPLGLYAALGLRLADVWEVFGSDCELVASTPLDPRFFERHWLTPCAIFVPWDD